MVVGAMTTRMTCHMVNLVSLLFGIDHIDRLVQEKRNSPVLAMEFRLSSLTHRHISEQYVDNIVLN